MHTKERLLQALLELSGRAGARPRPEIAAIALRLALPLFDASGAVVALAQGRHVEGFSLITGAAEPDLFSRPANPGDLSRLLRSGRPIAIPDLGADTRLSEDLACPGVGAGPALLVPLRVREQEAGYLGVYRKRGAAALRRRCAAPGEPAGSLAVERAREPPARRARREARDHRRPHAGLQLPLPQDRVAPGDEARGPLPPGSRDHHDRRRQPEDLQRRTRTLARQLPAARDGSAARAGRALLGPRRQVRRRRVHHHPAADQRGRRHGGSRASAHRDRGAHLPARDARTESPSAWAWRASRPTACRRVS